MMQKINQGRYHFLPKGCNKILPNSLSEYHLQFSIFPIDSFLYQLHQQSKNILQNKYISRILLHPPRPSKLLILDRVVLIKFSIQKQFDSQSSNKCMKSIHLEMEILAIFQIYIAILGFVSLYTSSCIPGVANIFYHLDNLCRTQKTQFRGDFHDVPMSQI